MAFSDPYGMTKATPDHQAPKFGGQSIPSSGGSRGSSRARQQQAELLQRQEAERIQQQEQQAKAIAQAQAESARQSQQQARIQAGTQAQQNLISVSVGGRVSIGNRIYIGNSYIPEVGMTANEYSRSLRVKAIEEGALDKRNINRVSFDNIKTGRETLPTGEVIIYDRYGNPSKIEADIGYGKQSFTIENYNKEVTRINKAQPETAILDTRTGSLSSGEIEKVRIGALELTPRNKVKVYTNPETGSVIQDINKYMIDNRLPYSTNTGKGSAKQFLDLIGGKEEAPVYDIVGLTPRATRGDFGKGGAMVGEEWLPTRQAIPQANPLLDIGSPVMFKYGIIGSSQNTINKLTRAIGIGGVFKENVGATYDLGTGIAGAYTLDKQGKIKNIPNEMNFKDSYLRNILDPKQTESALGLALVFTAPKSIPLAFKTLASPILLYKGAEILSNPTAQKVAMFNIGASKEIVAFEEGLIKTYLPSSSVKDQVLRGIVNVLDEPFSGLAYKKELVTSLFKDPTGTFIGMGSYAKDNPIEIGATSIFGIGAASFAGRQGQKNYMLNPDNIVDRLIKSPEKTNILKNIVYTDKVGYGAFQYFEDLTNTPKGMSFPEYTMRDRVRLSPQQTSQLKNLVQVELDLKDIYKDLKVEPKYDLNKGLFSSDLQFLQSQLLTDISNKNIVVAGSTAKLADVTTKAGGSSLASRGLLSQENVKKYSSAGDIDVAVYSNVELGSQKFEQGLLPAQYKAKAELSELNLGGIIDTKKIKEVESYISKNKLNEGLDIDMFDGLSDYQRLRLEKAPKFTKVKGSILRKTYDLALLEKTDILIKEVGDGSLTFKERKKGYYNTEQTKAVRERLDITGKDIDREVGSLLGYKVATSQTKKILSEKFPDLEQREMSFITLEKGLPQSDTATLGGFIMKQDGKDLFFGEGKATQITISGDLPKTFQASPKKAGNFELDLYRVLDKSGEAMEDIGLGGIAEKQRYKGLFGKERTFYTSDGTKLFKGKKLSSYFDDLLDRLVRTEEVADVYKVGKKVADEISLEKTNTQFINPNIEVKITGTGAKSLASQEILSLIALDKEIVGVTSNTAGRSVIYKQPAPIESKLKELTYPEPKKVAEFYSKQDYPDLFYDKSVSVDFEGKKINIQGRTASGVSNALAYISREVFADMGVAGKDAMRRAFSFEGQTNLLKEEISKVKNVAKKEKLTARLNKAIEMEMMGEGVTTFANDISFRKQYLKNIFSNRKESSFIDYNPRNLLGEPVGLGKIEVTEPKLTLTEAKKKLKGFVEYVTPAYKSQDAYLKAEKKLISEFGTSEFLPKQKASSVLNIALNIAEPEILSAKKTSAKALGDYLNKPYQPTAYDKLNKDIKDLYSNKVSTKKKDYDRYNKKDVYDIGYSSYSPYIKYKSYSPYTKYDKGYSSYYARPYTKKKSYSPSSYTKYDIQGAYVPTAYTPTKPYNKPYIKTNYSKYNVLNNPLNFGKKIPTILPNYNKIQKQGLRKVKTFSVSVKRGGEFRTIGSGLAYSKALGLGELKTRKTLARTFSVKETGFKEVGIDEQYAEPDLGIFRKYKIRGGKKLALPTGKFIQKTQFSLSSMGEQQEIQRARRNKLNDLINM